MKKASIREKTSACGRQGGQGQATRLPWPLHLTGHTRTQQPNEAKQKWEENGRKTEAATDPIPYSFLHAHLEPSEGK